MYRIISGIWKSKRIAAPKNFEVRPTTDFAKEALFSILEHKIDFRDIAVLDLFAGIGSISLEFASRQAAEVTSVDKENKHVQFISQTAKDLAFSQLQTIRADVFIFLKKYSSSKRFNCVFADPPFDLPEADYETLIELVLGKELLAENGWFILEHASRHKILHDHLIETRKYGNVSFSFFKKK